MPSSVGMESFKISSVPSGWTRTATVPGVTLETGISTLVSPAPLGSSMLDGGSGAAVPGGLDLHGNLDRLAVLLRVLNSLAADLGRRLGLAVFVGFHRAGGAVSGLVLGDGTAVLLRLGLGHGAVLASGGLGHRAVSPGLGLGGRAVGIVLCLRFNDRIAVMAVPVGGDPPELSPVEPPG